MIVAVRERRGRLAHQGLRWAAGIAHASNDSCARHGGQRSSPKGLKKPYHTPEVSNIYFFFMRNL
jgi:hypothetical protein